MVWKNPFLSKNSEQQIREDEFLALFDCTVLQMVEDQNLSKVSYVSSTPGAGKTSLFRSFSSRILNAVVESEDKEQYKGIYNQMERLGVIREGRVALVTAALSCARNYSIIDEMFQNGRKKQVFFALLNYRIAITFLRSIGQLLDLEVSEYSRITFHDIPSEMMSEMDRFRDGNAVYRWACEGERRLCQFLDSDRSEKLDISFVHMTLLLIRLFEPANILVDGQIRFCNVLLIFDDFHKLSEAQKEYLSEAVYTLKSSVGIWLGQRLEGVKSAQLISMDGSLSRDYNPNIVFDNYWPEKSGIFYGMLGNIADRRVKEADIGNLLGFADCIAESLEDDKYACKLKRYADSIRGNYADNTEAEFYYERIFAYIEEKIEKIIDKAIWYECVRIQDNRNNSGQLSLALGEQLDPIAFSKFVDEHTKGAWYYICIKCDIPFYFGYKNLQMISSYNVEQFLVFAGAYFDCCRVKLLGGGVQRRKYVLSAEEQMEILNNTVKQQWEDMDFRYTNIDEIKRFLDNIADWGAASRRAERDSYAGGAYTGIAINSEELRQGLTKPKYAQLITILSSCMASKYLERRENRKGELVVFYLNRWLCVHYRLPLAYGGWKKCSLDKALEMCQKSRVTYSEEQLELDL